MATMRSLFRASLRNSITCWFWIWNRLSIKRISQISRWATKEKETTIMAATPYRATCTIDGNKFGAVEVDVTFETAKDGAGMPQMGSLKTTIQVVVDFHDDKNLPYASLSKFFDLAKVVTRDK